jgi:hypothetical protein
VADIASPVNTSSQSLDALVTTAAATPYLKEGIVPRSASGVDDQVAAQRVGTHADDGTFAVGTDAVVVIAGQADETSPDSVSEGDAGGLRMTLARNLHVVNVADAAAVTSVASQDTNITLLAANANRIGATIYNTDSGPLFVKFGATATATTSFTVRIVENGYYEFPQPVYRGIVDGIWTSSSTGAAVITELT